MADFRVSLGVDVQVGDIQSQINAIRLDPIDLNVNLNTRDLQNQIGNIRQQLVSLSNTRLNIGGGGIGRGNNALIGNINNNISQIATTANNANNTILRLRQTLASAKFDNASIDMVTQHLEQMNLAVTNVTSRIRNNNLRLNITGIDELGRTVTVLKEIDLATGQITNIGKNISQSFGRSREEVQQTNAAYREMKSLIKDINNTSISINKNRASGKNVGALEHKLAALNARYDELEANFADGFDVNQTRNLSNEWEKIAHNVNVANDAISSAKSNLANSINENLISGTFDNQIDKAEGRIRKLSVVSIGVSNAMDEVRAAYQNIQNISGNGTDDELIAANQRYERSLKSLGNQLDMAERAQRDFVSASKLASDRSLFQSDIDAWMTKNSAAVKKFGDRLLELKARAESCDDIELDGLRSEFKQIDREAEVSGLKMQTFGDRLKGQFQKYSQYFSVAQVMMYATQAMRDMFQQVLSIDTAMTELKKVTDESDASYNRFLKNAASRSKELGTTIDGLVSSTADFARLGYDFEQAAGLAEVANIYTVVGDEIDGVEGATQSLVSTLAAFKHEMGDMSDSDFAMSIVDKFNEVSNNFAISSGGIGEALQRSASSLAAANNTLDESIALITAANEVTQNPEKVGNAMKTISMRIRGAKSELEEAGESTEGMVESTATLREEILALSGVDIMKNTNEFKSTYAIMDELADKWEGLSDIAQATIIEKIAGKHQGNVFSSLMSNFDTARRALETSATSSGSAMAEHAKWSDSLEARLNKLKATWQSLSQSFLSSGFLKGGLSVITGLADGVDALVNKFGALPTLVGTFAAGLSMLKNQGIFKFDKSTNSIRAFNIELSNMAKTYSSLKSSIGDYNFLSSQQKSLTKQQSMLANLTKKDSLSKQGATMLNQQELIKQQSQVEKQQKQLAETQKNFNKSISQSNTSLANYFAGLNGGKASMTGYIASLVGAKVATFALQAATIVLNAALTMGISALVSWGVSAISKWINEANELAEKVDETTSKYKDQHAELMRLKNDYDTTKEDSMISKYGELSKGVDAFGRNLSLTADEYKEYQSIVGTIADQIPSLVSGYDSQGNAILSCAGNVGELTKAYENLIKTQNNEVLINSAGDINKDFQNAVKDAEYNTKGWFGGADWTQDIGLGATKLSTKSAQIYKDIVNAKDAVAEFNKAIAADEYGSEEYLDGIDIDAMSELLEKAGFEKNGKGLNKEQSISHVKRALEENREAVNGILTNYFSELEADAEAKKAQAQAALSNALDLSDSVYHGMSDTMKNIARQTVGSFDFGFFADLEDQGISVETYVNDMLNSLNSLDKMDKKSIETAFDLRTQFNGGDISYGEYVGSIKEVGSLIDGLTTLPPETRNAMKNALNIDGVIEQYETLSNFLQNDLKFDESAAEKFLNSLSAEEFAVLMDIKPELDAGATASEIQDMIDKEMAMRGLTVKLSIEVEKANIEALTTALSESVSGTGMSTESINAIEGMFKNLRGYDPSKLFERTANGIRLNRQELNNLNSEYSKTNLAELNKEMSSLGDIYNQTREELYKLAYGTDEYNSKLAELNNIESQINNLEELKSQYEGLASAYQQWQIAESTGNERDMYESVISGIATVKDELSRGWADSGTREFLQLLRGDTATIIDGNGVAKEIDIATASAKELKQVWDDLDKIIEHTAEGGHKGYSLSDFFTTDKDGNATAKGVYNFLDALGHMEEEVFGGTDIIKRDDKTGAIIGFNFDLVGGDKVIAEALGISEELVQIMTRAAADAGFVVGFDGTFQQLDVLREKAQLAAESMNRILKGENKKTIEIDMNADSLDEIQPQIDSIMEAFGKRDGSGKLTGAIDMSIKGAEDALTVVSTLQSMKDRLERPTYMKVQTSQVDDALKKPLQDLQNYRTGIEQLNQAKLHGADTTELEASIEESKNKAIDGLMEIQETNPKLAAELDIDGLSREEIAEKVEAGKITIPATIDIQLEMDEKLGILVDKALVDAGLLDPKEFEKRVDIYLNGNADSSDAENAVDNAISEVEEKAEGKSEHKPIVIEQDFDLKLTNGEVDATGLEDGVKTGAEGHLNAMGVVETETDVKANAGKIDTSDVSNKSSEAIQEESGKTETLEKDVQLEFNINDYVDELSKFKDVAKELEGLEDITVKINANLEGELNSDDVDKLKAFAEGAKELQGASNKDISIKANFEGNLSDSSGIENLAAFAKGAKELNGVKSGEFSITANLDGSYLDATSSNITDLKTFAEGAKALKGVEDTDVSVTANLDGTLGTWTGNIDDLATFAEQAKALQGVNEDISVSVNANISGDISSESVSNLEKFAYAVNALPKSAVNISVKASVDAGSINNAITLLNQVSSSGLFKDYSANVTVTFKRESAEVDNYNPEDHTRTVTYEKDSSAVDSYNPPNLTRTVTYNIVTVGSAGAGGGGFIGWSDPVNAPIATANGTAHANGTAFADGTTSGRAFRAGDWRTKESGVALMGELGRELIVRDGRFFTVGDNGAGFYPYKKGDIIFNHKQTEELFRNGYVTSGGGRGRALASGTAFAEGKAFNGVQASNGYGSFIGDYESGSGGNGGSSSSSSSNSDEASDEFKETLDWIEIKIDRIERAIKQLDTKASSIYRSWTERNESITEQIATIGDEIRLLEQAYDAYMKAADAVGLDESYAQKVRDGSIDVETITDEDLKEKIDEYQELYEKALDAKDSILELQETESELYAQRVKNVATQYEGIISIIEHEKNVLEEYINQSEAQAWLVSSKYYDALARNERETIEELEKQKAEMIVAFEEAMASGTIAEGSEGWSELVNSINEVTLKIQESQTALLEYDQTIQQLSWEIFDLLQDKISSVANETEFLIELLSNKKLYDDNGQLTDEGKSTMGLHGVAYNVSMHQADLVAEEIKKLEKELEKDPFDTELEERYREMVELHQEYILQAEDAKNAIRDLVEEGIQLELDALDERIEKYEESLDSARDLYEYNKKVKKQSEEIANLEKQRLAYKNDDSEEAKAKLQEIEVSLQEAKEELESTEYDKFIDDSAALLDNLYLEYETVLNERLDNVDYLVSQMIDEINANSAIIGDTIRETTDSVGYTLSESMKTIWSESSTGINTVITNYGDKFLTAETTTNNSLNAINTNLQSIISQLNKIAGTNAESAKTSSVKKAPKKETASSTPSNKKPSFGGNGKPQIGDRVKYMGGKYYYDSQGQTPLGSQKQGKYVYITNINERDWATHGYHISTGNKLGNGDLGWLKLNQIQGYETGKKKSFGNEVAWTQEDGKEFIVRPSDGAILTPVAKGDSILTSAASKNIWNMANSPAEFIRDNLKLNTSNVPNNSNVQSNYTQHLDKVVFNLPNVKNYEELLSAMQKDRNFERLIYSMSIDRIAGKSSLGKGKSIR